MTLAHKERKTKTKTKVLLRSVKYIVKTTRQTFKFHTALWAVKEVLPSTNPVNYNYIKSSTKRKEEK